MKKQIIAGIAILAACTALCAPVWPHSNTEEKVYAETQMPAVTEQIATVEPPVLPVSDAVPRPIVAQATEVEEVPSCDDAPEMPEEETQVLEVEDECTEQPQQTVPTAESQPVSPKMGDTRIADGQKQVYFLGFGWIECSDEPNEVIYAGGIYENGNKIGSMGGGTDGCDLGDINKMVGIMG
jgi:hypothetical protein